MFKTPRYLFYYRRGDEQFVTDENISVPAAGATLQMPLCITHTRLHCPSVKLVSNSGETAPDKSKTALLLKNNKQLFKIIFHKTVYITATLALMSRSLESFKVCLMLTFKTKKQPLFNVQSQVHQKLQILWGRNSTKRNEHFLRFPTFTLTMKPHKYRKESEVNDTETIRRVFRS